MKKFSRFSQMMALMLALVAISFACVDDDYDTPVVPQIPIGNIYTIQQVKDSLGTALNYQFKNDASVYATVTMDNETDNSYRTFFIQDATAGIAVYQDVSGGVYIGDSVRIYLKDLIVMKYSGLFQINSISGAGVNVDDNVIKQGANHKRTPEEVTIAQIIETDSTKAHYQGRLVKILDAQFIDDDTSKTFYYAPDGTTNAANKKLQDLTDNQIIVRTSSYATFQGFNIPNGSGSLIAIVSQFNSDMQLSIRRYSEVEMTNERFDVNTGGGGGTGDVTGTFENPFDVAGGIENQGMTGVWVEGYIVGVYETNTATYTASFTAPFVTNSNMIIADSPTETDLANCLIVQLPAGDIRNPLNLVDNVGNLGKQVKLLGSLEAYFSVEGLKFVSGYWMDGSGIIPETGFYEEDFATDITGFSTFSVVGTEAWVYATYDNGCAKMSGHVGTSDLANQDWLVSPKLDLSGKTNVTMVLREAINYLTSYNDVQVLVSTDYDATSNPSTQGTWTPLTGFSRPAGNSWDFAASGDIDLSAYDGETNFFIAFKYVSTTDGAATWEVGNVLLKESAK